MASSQGPVICPAVRAKQAGVYTLPVNVPLVNARLVRNGLWRFKGINGYKSKVTIFSPQLNAQGRYAVQCCLSSSSNNGGTSENFNENDGDYVNSSIVEAGVYM